MTVSFRARDGKISECDFTERNLNLLAHAQAIELNIGSRCGGHGVCGGDRILTPESDRPFLSPITDKEREHFTPDELKEGWRLACQCFPEKSGINLAPLVPAMYSE